MRALPGQRVRGRSEPGRVRQRVARAAARSGTEADRQPSAVRRQSDVALPEAEPPCMRAV